MTEIVWIPAFAGMTGANPERRRNDNSVEFNANLPMLSHQGEGICRSRFALGFGLHTIIYKDREIRCRYGARLSFLTPLSSLLKPQLSPYFGGFGVGGQAFGAGYEGGAFGEGGGFGVV